MKTKIIPFLAAMLASMVSGSFADEISLASAPPVVVRTEPTAGATDVDPALTEIKVTYSKTMQNGSWSWSTWGRENYPETTGTPHYESDDRTCVLPVKLQPGKFYALWLNSEKFHNFKDAAGQSAVPYLLTFTTASDAEAANRANEIVAQSIQTISQCADGDPRVTAALAKLKPVPESKLIPAVATYLDSSQDTIRRSAVYVLWRGGFGDIGPAIEPLQRLLTHREDLTRGMAALALGGNKIAASYDGLAKMTTDASSGYARRCAAYALGLLGDPRAEPVLKRALNDKEKAVQNNAKTALEMLKTAKPPTSAANGSVTERSVDKTVSEFPDSPDLSTPEGACAAWQRASAGKDAQVVSRLSLVPIDPKEQEAWYEREAKRDPEGLAVYLKALADSKIISVQTWRGELANVITFLPFPEGKGRSPYSARTFGLVNGEWKNLGEDRLPSLDAARDNFEKKKETLWQHFQRAKSAAPTRAGAAAWENVLNDDQRAVLACMDRQFRSYFDARNFSGWSDQERHELETRSLDALKGPRSRDYYQAINTLGALHSPNGLPALRAIAYERADRNNRDRWMAIRSLGMIDDPTDVPELIHLVYHGNINTRWWAQVTLVRMTGQNFGGDWNAWAKWWTASGGQPAYQPEIIRWWDGQPAPDQLAAALAENDQKFLTDVKAKTANKSATPDTN